MRGGDQVGRPLTPDDLPWILSLAYERYRPFNPGTTLTWLVHVMRAPPALALRTEHAFLTGNILFPPWQPKDLEFTVIFLCTVPGYHWQAAGLLRRSVR